MLVTQNGNNPLITSSEREPDFVIPVDAIVTIDTKDGYTVGGNFKGIGYMHRMCARMIHITNLPSEHCNVTRDDIYIDMDSITIIRVKGKKEH